MSHGRLEETLRQLRFAEPSEDLRRRVLEAAAEAAAEGPRRRPLWVFWPELALAASIAWTLMLTSALGDAPLTVAAPPEPAGLASNEDAPPPLQEQSLPPEEARLAALAAAHPRSRHSAEPEESGLPRNPLELRQVQLTAAREALEDAPPC